jgi:hypothetical protein
MLRSSHSLAAPVDRRDGFFFSCGVWQVTPTVAEEHCPCFVRELTSCSLLQREQITCNVQKERERERKIGVVSLYATDRKRLITIRTIYKAEKKGTVTDIRYLQELTK